MKAVLLSAAILAFSLLSCQVDCRRFKDEQTNQALKNTRRVKQSFGSPRQIYWNFDKHFWRLDMLPPVLEVGYEFEQSQPVVNTFKTSTSAGTPIVTTYNGQQGMRAWKIRAKLRGRGNVKINSRFNIDKLFYNDITFQLDEIIAFLFGDIFVIFRRSDTATTTITNPADQYSWSDFNICFAAGYNYQDLSMSVESQFKFPQCFKMVVQSLCDWSQWFTIFQPTKQYLWGLLDQCTMTDDAPQTTIWEWNPVKTDSGDILLTPNDITNPALMNGVTSTTMGTKTTKSKTSYFYNMPGKTFGQTGCLFSA